MKNLQDHPTHNISLSAQSMAEEVVSKNYVGNEEEVWKDKSPHLTV